MKTNLLMPLAAGLLISTLSAPLSTAFAQGALTPPGAPAPTMKSLDQIEPRTPISSAPFTITQPGSYYLTTNLTATVSNAITIAVSGVTLDLNGFTISSTVPNAANGGTAILFNSGLSHSRLTSDITICNGHIRGGVTNDGSGFYSGSGFGFGIDGFDIHYSGNPLVNVLVSRVSVSGCLYDGIYLGNGDSTEVESCTVRTVGGHGISASTVKQSLAVDCGLDAIWGDQVLDCSGQSEASGIHASTIARNCYGYGNTGNGVYAAYSVQNCYGYSHGSGIGINAETALNCVGGSSSGHGLTANTAQNCDGYSVSSSGVYAISALNCIGSCGSGDGVNAFNAQSCFGISASGYGVYASQIAITCYGFSTSGTGLFAFIANSCSGNSINVTHKVHCFSN